MPHRASRRDFLEKAGLAAAAIPLWRRASAASFFGRAHWANSPPAFAALPIDLHDIRLLPGIQLTALEVNRKYLMGLSPDRLQAIMYGPLVLVGKLGTTGLTAETLRAVPTLPRTVPECKEISDLRAAPIKAPSDDPASWLHQVPGTALEFRTTGQATEMTFVPLMSLFDERYAVYFRIERA